LETQAEYDLEAAAAFVTVSSEIYPDLEPYYRAEAEQWYREIRAELELDDEETRR
jgi:hypothetical protein